MAAALVLGMAGASASASESREASPGQQVRLVPKLGHIGSAVAMASDGQWIVTAGADKLAKLWDVKTGLELRSFEGHTADLTSVTFSPDGRHVVTGSEDLTARVWEVSSGRELFTLTGHDKAVTSVAVSPGGKWFLTGSEDTTARLWDARTGKAVSVFAGHSREVTGVAFLPDGKHFITSSADGTARLWDLATRKVVRSLPEEGGEVQGIATARSGRRLASVSRRGTTIWDVDASEPLYTVACADLWPDSMALSPDGKVLAMGCATGASMLISVESGEVLRALDLSGKTAYAMAFSSDGRQVIASHWSGATLFDTTTGSKVIDFIGVALPVSGVAVSPRGEQLLVGSPLRKFNEGPETASLWSLRLGQVHQLKDWSYGVTSVAFSSDGAVVAIGSEHGRAGLYDVNSREQLRVFDLDGDVKGLAFAPDGQTLLTAGVTTGVHVWNARPGAKGRGLTHRFFLDGQRPSSIAYSPDGHLALVGTVTGSHTPEPFTETFTPSGSVALVEVDSGRLRHAFKGHLARVRSCAFSPDGTRAVTGSDDRTARIWHAESGRELQVLRGHKGAIQSVRFSHDGTEVLTASDDGTAMLWDVATGHAIRTFSGHSGPVQSAVFTPDGKFVVTGSLDGAVRFWDAQTGRALASAYTFVDGSWAVTDPDGRYDASQGGDVAGLHWVVGNTPIALSQLKERYYEPGLLAKVLGFNKEPLRPVQAFVAPKLFPAVKVEPVAPGDRQVRIRLRNQGGGIGKVRVLVNGKEVAADARGPKPQPTAKEAELVVDLAGAAILPGQENTVEVVAWNAEGYLSSRAAPQTWKAPEAKAVEPPELHAVVVGTSRYANAGLNLRFSGKDAADLATAIQLSARRLFGAERVHLTLLSDQPGAPGALPPTRANLEKALEEARRARPGDVLVVYLAGHGVAAPDGEYWYLTSEARTTDLSDPSVRATSGVSSGELTEWVKAIPALHQVLVLDTCAAGAASSKLTETRALTSDQVRAIDRLKDRTGLHVLMGSAADAVSYEASQYGQGLLTYALLEGMRGAALREDQFVDVARLFGHAVDRVPRLASSIGGVQRPVVASPRGSTFDIGQLASEDKARVPLSLVKPLLLRASLQLDERPYGDKLGLSRRVNASLRAASEPSGRGGGIVFVDGDELPGALQLFGRYRRSGDQVVVNAYLMDGDVERGHVEATGSAEDLDGIAHALAEKAAAAAVIAPPR